MYSIDAVKGANSAWMSPRSYACQCGSDSDGMLASNSIAMHRNEIAERSELVDCNGCQVDVSSIRGDRRQRGWLLRQEEEEEER
jgi:hypothetical protein